MNEPEFVKHKIFEFSQFNRNVIDGWRYVKINKSFISEIIEHTESRFYLYHSQIESFISFLSGDKKRVFFEKTYVNKNNIIKKNGKKILELTDTDDNKRGIIINFSIVVMANGHQYHIISD